MMGFPGMQIRRTLEVEVESSAATQLRKRGGKPRVLKELENVLPMDMVECFFDV
jgi:hypothetical protein